MVVTPSFVGSQVPMAYPLRQETGIVPGRVEPVRAVASQAYPSPYYPPTRRERSTDTSSFHPFRSAFSTLERPMKIEIVVDPVNIPAQSLASRVAPAPTVTTTETVDAPRYGEDPLSCGVKT